MFTGGGWLSAAHSERWSLSNGFSNGVQRPRDTHRTSRAVGGPGATVFSERFAGSSGRAAYCRLTERAVQKIIFDLEQDDYLSHTREGRANTYRIEPGKVLRHPAEAGLTVASLLSWLVKDEADRKMTRVDWTRPCHDRPPLVDGRAHRGSQRSEGPSRREATRPSRRVLLALTGVEPGAGEIVDPAPGPGLPGRRRA